MTLDAEEISLRPLSLRPGGSGSNPFAGFGKGAGFAIRSKAAASTATVTADAPRKPPGQIIKYSQEFLLQFMDRYHQCPLDLQQSQLEIVFAGDEDRDVQRQTLQRVAEEAVDDRDWRVRVPLADTARATSQQGSASERSSQAQAGSASQPAPAQQPRQQSSQPERGGGGGGGGQAPAPASARIQRAVDIGREAYKPGATLSSEARALRSIKGILNKLTPEKFERLVEQLLQVITTAATLEATIGMVFENAVAQPTFCAMYADLCLRLSHELPSFPPQDGDGKPLSFKRVLLNTCQDEFEGAANAREELQLVTEPSERAAAERAVKLRTLGTVRLIAELYRKDVVKETIVVVVVRELLEARNTKALPPEENIEAACEMITICGKQLASSESKKAREALEGYMARLLRLGDTKELSSRVRFIIKDVLEMRKNRWVPRRETFTAKKLEEVHAEAEAELGMVSSRIGADLPALPTQSRTAADDFALLPPLRGGEDGWEYVGRQQGGGGGGGGRKPAYGGGGGGSALIGDYTPPPPLERRAPPAAAAPPAPVAPPPATAAAPGPKAPPKPSPSGAPLSEEDVEAKALSTFREFVSVRDAKEAAACIRELNAPAHHAVVARVGLSEAMDALQVKDQGALTALLLDLSKQGVLQRGALVEGVRTHTADLEGLSMDVPVAPALLGGVFGSAVAGGDGELGELAVLLEPCESGEVRRRFAAAALKAFRDAQGAPAVTAAAKAAALASSPLLDATEFDEDKTPTLEWLQGEGLEGLLL